ncbi:MAG: hypothetical protein A2Z93_01855 [Curvibacter sp. GWA2_64_110]|nr:MAG: hypothetical protein A2Z93_01855 [Curvibacter sp. GWA2_64_110]
MKHPTKLTAPSSQYADQQTPHLAGTGLASRQTTEYLPFIIRPIRDQGDLRKALEVRHAAYARHMPLFADALRSPEADDLEDDVMILLAESKLDGSSLGSARIQNNLHRPLNLEQSVDLPPWLKEKRLAEARRLSVAPGSPGRLVKMALIKACLMYSFANQLQWSVLAARPPLDRSYEKLLFRDLLEGETFIPLPRENNVPHRVLGLDMENLEAAYTQAQHPLLGFFCHTRHPDIHVGNGQAIKAEPSIAPSTYTMTKPSMRAWA